MEFIFVAIIIAFSIFIILWIYRSGQQRLNELKSENKILKADNERYQQKELDFVHTKALLEASISTKEELLSVQRTEISNIREQFNKDFQLLANRILEEKTSKFTDINRLNMESILKPLNEKLSEFKVKVEETYDKESKQRFSLEERIKELVSLNQQISEDANNLTKALKGNSKIQGNWGEMILESILEKSGLKKGEEYFTQEILTNDAGERILNEEHKALQPDVVVVYPGGRKIVVDSKVSLNGYVKYIESDTDEERIIAEKEHILSVKKHIDELSAKAYQDYIDSLDFVMMFVPNEPAYILAMQLDSSIWDYAYRKRILLISPTNLIASLKVVADLWKRESQSRNAQEIARRGTIMYDKFVGFVETLQDVGKNMERTQRSYDKALMQLRDGNGNLIRQAEMLKDLGIKSQKDLPDSSLAK